ncbi:MAG: bifunctional nuclease family protein [Chloroflexia bacterium]|nr:bifunctional nuclease family protein [Chloroflexia bacterium]
MVKVVVHSVRVSLITQNRVVVLKEAQGNRYLPIWIGPYEADAIALKMQEVELERPFTHDLLCSIIDCLGGKVMRVLVNDIRDKTFYARVIFDVGGRYAEVDSRPSDAIALAVRLDCPIFIAQSVLEEAGLSLDEDESAGTADLDEEGLDVFRDFFRELGGQDEESGEAD